MRFGNAHMDSNSLLLGGSGSLDLRVDELGTLRRKRRESAVEATVYEARQVNERSKHRLGS